MAHPCRILIVLAALAAVLSAQTRKPAERKKDDRITAKDPAIVAIDKFQKKKVSTRRKDWKSTLPVPPELSFTAGRDYYWHLATDQGVLKIKLLPATAPRHVSSTIFLARAGFYDELRFPRVVKGFMAQGGSPDSTTGGNAGYTLDHEFSEDELHDVPGTLSAANAGAPNTDGSQFFLTFVATPHLDGKHTVYGRVVEGLETLKKIEACGVEPAKDGEKLAHEPVILQSWVTVEPTPEPAAEAAEEAEKKKGEGKDG